MKHLSIELEPPVIEKLSLLAERSGKSVEALAAELLTAQVEDGELNRLRLEIVKVREDLALATQALLVTANGVRVEEARKWVKENLRHH